MSHRQDYINKIETKKQARFDAGLVADRFPKVSGIVINMTYYHNADNPVLMERTVNIFPNSHAYFNMDCMIKGCENGGFNLKPVITKQIKERKKSVKGTLACKGKSASRISSEHAKISYEINIKYAKGSK